MRYRLGFLVVLLLCLVADSASAQVTLRWKLNKGDDFYVMSRTVNDQQLAAMLPYMSLYENVKPPVRVQLDVAKQAGSLLAGANQSPLHVLHAPWVGFKLYDARQKVEQATIWHCKVNDAKEDKTVVVEVEIVAINLNRVGSNALHALAPSLRQLKFKVTLNGKMEITALEGYEKLLDAVTAKLGGNSAEEAKKKLRESLKETLPEEQLKRSLQDIFAGLPADPVEPKAIWTREVKEPLPPFGEVTRNTKFKYEGIDNDIASRPGAAYEKITSTIELTAQVRSAVKTSWPFQIHSADLRSEKSTGLLLFDSEAGKLIRSETEITLRGPVVLSFTEEFNNRKVDTFLFQTIKTSVELMKELPQPDK